MPHMRDRKVWKVWGWEVWPPEDYDAIYKSAQSPTILHFPPPRPNIKNISKIYFAIKPLHLVSNQTFSTIFRGYLQTILSGVYWIHAYRYMS